MDSKTSEQFQQEIQKEFSRMMSNSNIGEILEKYNLLSEKIAFELKCSLGDAQVNSIQAEATESNLGEVVTALCDWCIPCPTTGNPRGCCCL
jgi:hypothetical protein